MLDMCSQYHNGTVSGASANLKKSCFDDSHVCEVRERAMFTPEEQARRDVKTVIKTEFSGQYRAAGPFPVRAHPTSNQKSPVP